MSDFSFTEAVGFTEPVDNPVLLANIPATNINGALYSSPVFDLRAYPSYALRLNLTGGTMNATDIIQLNISFSPEPSGLFAYYTDKYLLTKTNVLGSTPFHLSDVGHGAYMQIQAFDANSVGRSFDIDYRLYGSYRPLYNAFLRTNTDFLIHQDRNVLGAGAASAAEAMQLAWGRAKMRLRSGAGGGATMRIAYAGSTIVYDEIVAGAANTTVEKEIILPRHQGIVTITNNGAAVSTIDSFVIREVDAF